MELEKRIEVLEKKVAALEVQAQEQLVENIVKQKQISKFSLMAEVIQVIHISVTRGDGTAKNPVRIVNQYWSFTGELLAENDPID